MSHNSTHSFSRLSVLTYHPCLKPSSSELVQATKKCTNRTWVLLATIFSKWSPRTSMFLLCMLFSTNYLCPLKISHHIMRIQINFQTFFYFMLIFLFCFFFPFQAIGHPCLPFVSMLWFFLLLTLICSIAWCVWVFWLVCGRHASIKAIETRSLTDDQQWLTYWVLYSLITLFELTFAKVLEL